MKPSFKEMVTDTLNMATIQLPTEAKLTLVVRLHSQSLTVCVLSVNQLNAHTPRVQEYAHHTFRSLEGGGGGPTSPQC